MTTRWSSGLTTSWPLSSLSRCEVKLHRTWSTTASWSRTPDAHSFAPLTPTSSLFREQTLDLAIGVSRSLVREFGTVYPPHCGSLTLNLDTLNDFKGISVCRDRGALVILWFQCAVYKSIYLLTYHSLFRTPITQPRATTRWSSICIRMTPALDGKWLLSVTVQSEQVGALADCFPAARKSHNARFYTQITQAMQSKTRFAREIEHVLIWRKPYHVTNSSHVIGNLLRTLRSLRIQNLACLRCVHALRTLRALETALYASETARLHYIRKLFIVA